MKRLAIAGMLWCVLGAVCQAQGGEKPAEAGGPEEGLEIAAGDRVEIAVYKAPDLTVAVKVPESGEIVYPILGRIQMGGVTTGKLAAQIARKLEEQGHLHNAEVSVTITEMAQYRVFVLGAVKTPGPIVFRRARPLYLTQAVSIAGGFAGAADRKDVRVIRRPGGGKGRTIHVDVAAVLEKGRAEQDVELADGDTIFVAEVEAIYVYGQVNSPGAYRPPPGVEATVSRVVSLAGGTTRFARTNKTRVIHRTGGEKRSRIETVDLKAVVEAGRVEQDVKVYPGDIIFIPETLF